MNNSKNKIVTIVIIVMIFINFTFVNVKAVSVEEKNMSFERITIENGLTQASIYSLFQDSMGYMWIGTADGLNRYNGKKIERYKYKQGEKNTIIGSYISSINEDSYGNVWVGTTRGLNKINLSTGEIKNYFPKEKGCKLSHYNVTEILRDSAGEIYVATVDGVNKYNRETDNFERLFYSQDKNKSLTSQVIYTMVEDGHGDLWIGTTNGLNKVDKNGNVAKYYNDRNNTNSIGDNFIYQLYVDKEGFLWIGTNSGGLNRLNIETGKIDRFVYDKNKNSISGNSVRHIIDDNQGYLWIATDKGLCKYDKYKDEFFTYENKIYDTKSLISDDVYSLYQDKSGTIWVGTYKGIGMFNPQNKFTNYRHDPLDKNSLTGSSIGGIYEENDGELWVGTTHNGVNIISNKRDKVTRIQHDDDKNSISSDSIRDIVGIDNEIWIATENGLNKYDKTTGKFTIYKSDETTNGLIDNDIRSLFVDKDGILWIGSAGGICSYDRKGQFKRYNEILRRQGLAEFYFSDIYQDYDGTMWFGLGIDGGLVKYNTKTEEAKIYVHKEENPNSISSDSIKAIQDDGRGNIWVGTQYGINKFNKKTESFTSYTEKDGLSNNFVYGVLIDIEGNPWMSTNYGISKFEVNSGKFINYDVTDGIQGNEFNGYSFFKSKSGNMFFGGISGLTTFNPKNIKDDFFVAQVNIENISTGGKNVILKPNIDLQYKDNQFEVKFFMPDYRNTSKIQYAYKLEGFDNDWVFSDERNYANYTNLKAGNYRFVVKGRNSRGEWSQEKYVNITIDNPPWKTPFAYVLYVIALVTLIYIIWNRVKLLDSLVKQRTNELNRNLKENEKLYARLIQNEKYKNNYFVNLSHELRTPLNVILSIQQLIKELNKDNNHIPKERIDYYMDTLKRNSNRLLKLINNIIDTSKIESGSYRLRMEDVDIVYLVEEAVLSMKDYIENGGVELIVDPQIEEKIIKCDECEIEKCIINLVANATKFTPQGGTIEVNIIDLGDKVEISVRDTGIGIEEKYQEAIFNRFGQAYNEASEEHGGSGLGLTLTKQLVKLHNGNIRVESTVGEGSKFIITLPVDPSK